MKHLVVIITVLAVLLSATAVLAVTETSPLNVTAQVVSRCRITSVTNLDFLTYDPTDPVDDDDGVGDVTFRCTRGTIYEIYIAGIRTMTDGVDTLSYELYQDAARTTVWPSGLPGVGGTSASNAPVTQGIYGRIPALQDVQAGIYSGTVTVTIEY
jgi:spore coat protein U-like protein